jgi:hypothetical protein
MIEFSIVVKKRRKLYYWHLAFWQYIRIDSLMGNREFTHLSQKQTVIELMFVDIAQTWQHYR